MKGKTKGAAATRAKYIVTGQKPNLDLIKMFTTVISFS